eukprot:170167-Prymnesium_polylepis.2
MTGGTTHVRAGADWGTRPTTEEELSHILGPAVWARDTARPAALECTAQRVCRHFNLFAAAHTVTELTPDAVERGRGERDT